MKLCLLYKIIHELCYIPSGLTGLVLSIRSHSLLLHQPFARTNAYYFSFVSHTKLCGTHLILVMLLLNFKTYF